MTLLRRQVLHLAAGTAALPLLSRIAAAADYPTRPVHIVTGYPAGAGPDIISRLIAQALSDSLSQNFIVDNRPGASSNIGTEIVAHAAPDGYTLLTTVSTNAVNATFYTNLNFNFGRDLMPVAGIVQVPNVMVINPSVPATTVGEFIAYSKANPAKVNMASAGIGSGGHLAGELFKMLAGITLTHVPYRGNGPALTALLGGQVEVLFASLPSSLEYIRTGKVRALGITSAKRSEAQPDLPTIAESVAGYDMSAWYGASVPKGTPAEVIDLLNREINAGLADPKTMARLAEQGGISIAGSPADFGKFIADETEKWGKVVRFAGMKPE